MSALNDGTIRSPCFTGSTCASVRHDTTPARSGRSCAAKSLADGRPPGGTFGDGTGAGRSGQRRAGEENAEGRDAWDVPP